LGKKELLNRRLSKRTRSTVFIFAAERVFNGEKIDIFINWEAFDRKSFFGKYVRFEKLLESLEI
jgi:hypothetical protein